MRHSFSKLCTKAAVGLAALLLAGLPVLANPTLVLDVKTGQVLHHEAAFDRWYPASLTKLMTIYVAFRAIAAGELELTSPIRMSKKAAKEPPSKMGYKEGQILTLDNALKILAVKSANDIATAVAENVGGTQEAFADRMNAEAGRLGMTGSHFVNAHGLPDARQYTTARDLGLLVRAIRTEFPQYDSFFSYEAIAVGKKQIHTNVVLLGRFEGADGMKTGFICASGFNMVSTATRNGRTLAAVVLGSLSAEARAETSAALLSEGFAGSKDRLATLATLQPYGAANNVVMDLKATICTDQAASERWAARDPEGKMVYRSPYLREPSGTPRVAVVGLGGATGPVPKAYLEQLAKNYADVPIPTWRPDRPEPGATTAAVQAQAFR